MPVPNSIAALGPELAEWRRDIHRHPELGYEETRTAALVAEKLRGFGFDAVETGIGGTGVVGALHGAGGAAGDESQAILLRADMDALPMQETGDAPHKSTVDGKMHACGHDGHTTMLLGAAKHLAETRNFRGTVYFCFQPAEEAGAGAKAMIEDGLFARFPCRQVFGMHNWPGFRVGEFALRAGPTLASADEFFIDLDGRGGHAAKPDKARDPIVAGAYLVTQLQTLVSRTVDPLEPAVVSITIFQAGSASNVIPGAARLGGTVRAFSEAVHEQIHDGIARLTKEVGRAYEMETRITRSRHTYPPTVNDAEATAFARAVAEDVAGPQNVVEFPRTMGAEDFSYMSREKAGCFVFCGNGDSAPLHNAAYDFNDDALPHGVAFWARLVETALPKS